MWFKRKKVLFGPDSPAANIEVLLNHLQRERTNKHYYRGQNRYFTHNAPSAVRAAALMGESTPKWVPLADTYWAVASAREQARFDLRVAAMRFWGPALGNLLCQQYGVTSDGYDITADPMIAAFFATRKYPHYRHLDPQDGATAGVIYRFTIEDQSDLDLETTAFTLSSYGYFDEAIGRWIYFSRPRNPRAYALYAARQNIAVPSDETIANLDEIPGRRQNLMKVEACLRYDAIAALFVENTRARHPSFCDEIDLRQTRIDRQAGGVYFPSFRHDAIIPEQPELHRIDAIRSIAPPGSAVFERTTHVQELHSFRSLEKFFFNHDAGCRIDRFSTVDLWPDARTDRLYGSMCELARTHCEAYLNTHHVEPDDFAQGVVDPGYLA